MKLKLTIALIVLFTCVPALAQRKRPAKKRVKAPVVAVAPATTAAAAAPAKKVVPRMVVTAESSETAVETGKGIVLSNTPYSGATPTSAQPAAGSLDERTAAMRRALQGSRRSMDEARENLHRRP